jgi:glyoxylase-like metal-dependent hydrolase (beta-lactamase superfamily II)
MRLSSEVLLVGGGALTGFGLSADFDAHVYLLDGGSELALVDCGMGTELGRERVLANVRGDGLDPAAITRLLLTHYHTDHASGAARYREALGPRVAFSAAERRALEEPDHDRTSFAPAQQAGIFPPDFTYPGCPVDDALEDGDELAVGHLRVRYLATPGHCAGHGSYLVEGREATYLLGGDALFAGGKLFLQATADCDLRASLDTVLRLGDLRFDALLPGHGPVVLHDAAEHVGTAVSLIRSLAVPPNLV